MLLYADEDFFYPVVAELRRLGHDVLTAQQDGQSSARDPVILTRANALGRVLLTFNRSDFKRLHRQALLHTAVSCPRLKTMITPPWPLESTPPWPVSLQAGGIFESIGNLELGLSLPEFFVTLYARPQRISTRDHRVGQRLLQLFDARRADFRSANGDALSPTSRFNSGTPASVTRVCSRARFLRFGTPANVAIHRP